MLLKPRHFIRLFDNRYRDATGERASYATVAVLPLSVGAYMPTRAPEVFLGVDYAQKLIRKHHLRYEDFVAISELIDDSYCIKEKPNHLTFMGYRRGKGEAFILVLKAAKAGSETWVVTLHRSNSAQISGKLRRHRPSLIRDLRQEFEE